ncbi:hypothetical protein BU196_24270, partial [Streptomyces sp. CBMA370]|nr:hypothetical protein [Streptomyces sp. CBMA370]
MFEKWRTARAARGSEARGEAPARTEAPATPVAPGDAWRALPPVQRVLDGPRTVAEHGFASSLATHWNPSFQRDLGHGAVPDAPGGVLLDAVRPVTGPTTTSTELPGLRLPVAGRGATPPEPSASPVRASGAGPAVGPARAGAAGTAA